jgi:AraC family transcriptional regulator of adaptative response/methylated-DNA-[protein]-cysteine methyltransferase
VTPAQSWRIVLARDRRYDGAFVYAVRSTGIYCRPSCASRRPRRGQVSFFPIPEAAEREGFRACRRCRPGDAPGNDPAIALVREACRALDAPDAERPKLDGRLRRAFKRVLGITPQQYRDARRVARFKHELKRRPHVSPAVYEAGYGSSSRVYERSNAQLGMTPATYARGGAGTEIAFAVVPCSLGRLLVAATPRGVCCVSLGDHGTALEADLASEFPAAHIFKDQLTLEVAVTAILGYLDGSEPHLALPLDIRATAFQRRVWQELQKIPYGETRSYADVAKRIGRPTASRAVARACATNPAALVIPCHRVVREDGEMGGYRWGLDRKRILIEQEAGKGKS